jgi:hypothetical protein
MKGCLPDEPSHRIKLAADEQFGAGLADDRRAVLLFVVPEHARNPVRGTLARNSAGAVRWRQ